MSAPEPMILLTGAGGFLGRGFLESLSPEQAARCLCLTRKNSPELEKSCGKIIEGFFGDPASLRLLDPYSISAVVHLAAVTGGCSEADAAAINVEGTRVLMRYLIDRGTKRFVLASSIAATGIQRPDFRPLSLPITEEHPCLDRMAMAFPSLSWRNRPDISAGKMETLALPACASARSRPMMPVANRMSPMYRRSGPMAISA